MQRADNTVTGAVSLLSHGDLVIPSDVVCNTLVDALLHNDLVMLLPDYETLECGRLRTLGEANARLSMLESAYDAPIASAERLCIVRYIGAQQIHIRRALASLITGTPASINENIPIRATLEKVLRGCPHRNYESTEHPHWHPTGMRTLLRLSATCHALRHALLCAPIWQNIYTLCQEYLAYAPVCLPVILVGPQMRFSLGLKLCMAPKPIRDFYNSEIEGPREKKLRATAPSKEKLRTSHFIRLPNSAWVPRDWPAKEWFARAFFLNRCNPAARAPALCGGHGIEPTWTRFTKKPPRVFSSRSNDLPLLDIRNGLRYSFYVNRPDESDDTFYPLASFTPTPFETPSSVIIRVRNNSPSLTSFSSNGRRVPSRAALESIVPAVEHYYRCFCTQKSALQMVRKTGHLAYRTLRLSKKRRLSETANRPRKKSRVIGGKDVV